MKKLVLYNFEKSPLSTEFMDRLSSLVTTIERVDAEADYSGALAKHHLEEAEGLITRVFDHYPNELLTVPELRYVGTTHTDTSHFDKAFLGAHGITLTNVPGYSTNAVAELTLGMLLNLVRHLPPAIYSVSQGDWVFEPFLGSEVRGKSIGIIGLGAIGRRVAHLADALGMEVFYTSRDRKADVPYSFLELPDLFASSDVVSVHCSLNQETRGLISEGLISKLKPGAVFLSPSRTETIDLDALYRLALSRDVRIWLDELQDRSWRHKFRELPNVFLTPDFGWYTVEAQRRLEQVTLNNLQAFLAGKPENVVT